MTAVLGSNPPAVTGPPDAELVSVDLRPRPRHLVRPHWLAAGDPIWVWLGLAVAGVGFMLIAIAWGQVAGETQVYRQLPYVVSAGFVGVALVLVGITIVNVAVRQRDELQRRQQLDQLVQVLEELQRDIVERKEPNQ